MNSLNKIQRLRILCGGTGNNPWYRHHHSPIKNCEILLSVEGFEKALKNPQKSSYWIKLANVLLPLTEKSEKSRNTFVHLLNLILDHPAIDGRDDFLLKIWNNAVSSDISLGVKDLEEFIKKEPKFLELKIIDIIEDIVNKKDLKNDEINVYWSNNRYSLLIKWCVESALVFSIVTSIMNEMLIRFSGVNFVKVLNLIMCFVYNVSRECKMKGKDFSSLYPTECRHLIYLLKCKPVFNRSGLHESIERKLGEEIVPIIQDELERRPEVIIALLSHHLAWYDE